MNAPRNEVLRARGPEFNPEGAAKGAQNLSKLKLQTEIQKNLRDTVMNAREPVINETEDQLVASSQAFEEMHPEVPQPEFYQAA